MTDNTTSFSSSEAQTEDANSAGQGWIAALKAMEADAWDELLRVYSDKLREGIQASLSKRGMPLSMTDDIEQETWRTAVQKIDELQWDDVEKLFHWLRAVSVNHIFVYRRRQWSEFSLDEKPDAEAEASLERFYNVYGFGVNDIEDQIARHEQFVAIDAAMRQLKPVEREMLLLWLNGKKPRELASHYDMKAHSISMLLLRAKEKIEATLLFNLMKEKDDNHE